MHKKIIVFILLSMFSVVFFSSLRKPQVQASIKLLNYTDGQALLLLTNSSPRDLICTPLRFEQKVHGRWKNYEPPIINKPPPLLGTNQSCVLTSEVPHTANPLRVSMVCELFPTRDPPVRRYLRSILGPLSVRIGEPNDEFSIASSEFPK